MPDPISVGAGPGSPTGVPVPGSPGTTLDNVLAINFSGLSGYFTTYLTGTCLVTWNPSVGCWTGTINGVVFTFHLATAGGTTTYYLDTNTPAHVTTTSGTLAPLSVSFSASNINTNPFNPGVGVPLAAFTATIGPVGSNVPSNVGSNGAIQLDVYVHDGTTILVNNPSAVAGDTNSPLQSVVVAVCPTNDGASDFPFPWSQVQLGNQLTPACPPAERYSGSTDATGLLSIFPSVKRKFRILVSKEGYNPAYITADCANQATGSTSTWRIYLDKLPPVDGTADSALSRLMVVDSLSYDINGVALNNPLLPGPPSVVFASSDNAGAVVVSGPWVSQSQAPNFLEKSGCYAFLGQDRYIWALGKHFTQTTHPQLASQGTAFAPNNSNWIETDSGSSTSGIAGSRTVSATLSPASWRLGTFGRSKEEDAGASVSPTSSDNVVVWLTNDAVGRDVAYPAAVLTSTALGAAATVALNVANGTYHVWAMGKRFHPYHATVTVSGNSPTVALYLTPIGNHRYYPTILDGGRYDAVTLQTIFGQPLPASTVCWFHNDVGQSLVGPVNARAAGALIYLPFKQSVDGVQVISTIIAVAFHPAYGLIRVQRNYPSWTPHP